MQCIEHLRLSHGLTTQVIIGYPPIFFGDDAAEGEPGMPIPGPQGPPGTAGSGGATAFSGARVYNSANIVITSATETDLTFDSERFDTDSYHSTGSNPERITIPVTATYLIGGSIAWDASTTGTRLLGIRINGSGNYIVIDHRAASNQGRQDVSTLYQFSAGDYVTLTVFQDSGGNVTLTKEFLSSLEFWIVRAVATGTQGPPGVTLFLDGIEGEEGMMVPGTPGAIGVTGATGAQGPIGVTLLLDGDQGEEGMPVPGRDGTAGLQGAPGVTLFLDGDEGAEGMPVPGNVGAQGPQGIQGIPGISLDGDEGPEGMPVPGNVGAQGPQGIQGIPGIALDGDEGPEGLPVPGRDGAAGLQGAPGVALLLEGYEGPEGMPVPGNVGAQGPQGIQGIQGIALDGDEGPEGMLVPGRDGRQFVDPLLNSFRLSVVSGDPNPTSDQTAKGTLYMTPAFSFAGITTVGTAAIAIYDGTNHRLYTSAEISLALTLTSGFNYDVFVFDNAGTLTLETLVWTSDTARATALDLQDGVLYKHGVLTRRYLGTIRASAANVTEDSLLKRFVWNYYNRVPRTMQFLDNTAHAYITITYRAWNASATARIQFVQGVAGQPIHLDMIADPYNAGNVSAGLDSTTTSLDPQYFIINNTTVPNTGGIGTTFHPGIGYHFVSVIEHGNTATGSFDFVDLTGYIPG